MSVAVEAGRGEVARDGFGSGRTGRYAVGMTLEQLRIFVAVAERQHVTRAAEALNLTQSAVSSAVTALEGRHGVALFDRVGRNVLLNPAGRMFLVEAKAVLTRVSAAETALADLSTLARGHLTIHASQTIASYWLPSRLARFHVAHPGIGLEVAIGNTAGVAKAVAEGEAELGLVEGEVDDPALGRTVVDHDRLALVVGADHPWARMGPKAKIDPRATSWVSREPGSGTRAAFVAAMERDGLSLTDLDIALVLPSNEAVRSAVEAGAGAAVIAFSAAAPGLRSGLLREVALTLPKRAFTLLRHKQRYRSRAGDAMAESLVESATKRSAKSNVTS